MEETLRFVHPLLKVRIRACFDSCQKITDIRFFVEKLKCVQELVVERLVVGPMKVATPVLKLNSEISQM